MFRRFYWQYIVSKDMKGVGIPDAMVMAEDRMRWKRFVTKHAAPQEGMLPDWLTDWLTNWLRIVLYCIFIYSQTWVTFTISLCNTFMQKVIVETSHRNKSKLLVCAEKHKAGEKVSIVTIIVDYGKAFDHSVIVRVQKANSQYGKLSRCDLWYSTSV